MRTFLRNIYLKKILQTARFLDHSELGRSAIIFSPHQDDETLGCGGTIVQKLHAGADLKVVFLTDGRQSHSNFIPIEDLIQIRREEAINACKTLGIHENNVVFLDFTDGNLGTHMKPAIERVSTLLRESKPEEVFIPYYKEPPPDHYLTNQIVLTSLKEINMQVTIYEYPLWLWYHWPWVGFRQNTFRETREVIKNTIIECLNKHLLKDFRNAVHIESMLNLKRKAIEKHKSQMFKIKPDTDWPTLGNISKGQFLACFFQPWEFFYIYRNSLK